MFPNTAWSDITDDFDGTFFRALGGSSATFGSIQEESCPRVTQARYGGTINNINGPVNLNQNEWSTPLSTGSVRYDASWNLLTTSFFTSADEVRPRNSAIRIWKRVF